MLRYAKLPSFCAERRSTLEMRVVFKYQQSEEERKSNNDRVGGRN